MSLPVICPACSSEIIWNGVDLQCTNVNCSAATVKQVESFIKNSGIENVSQKRLEEWGILTYDQLLAWTPDSSYKTQVEFYAELEKKVFNQLPEDIMRNFSFDGFGQTLFDNLMKHVGSFEKMHQVFKADCYADLPAGIGERTIDKASPDWFANLEVLGGIMLDTRYKRPEPKAPKMLASLALTGMSFLITGTLSVKRNVKEDLIKSHGGDIASGVTKNLTYLVAAISESGSSKYVKAVKLGIPIITEAELDAMIGV
jgi:DNA ligase (NAD+)